MSYNTSKLTTVAECDQAILLATDRKNSLNFAETLADHDATDQQKSVSLTKAKLVRTNAEILAAHTIMDSLPPDEDKSGYELELKNLETRKANLEARLAKSSSAHVVDGEVERELIALQKSFLDTYVADVNTRKAAL